MVNYGCWWHRRNTLANLGLRQIDQFAATVQLEWGYDTYQHLQTTTCSRSQPALVLFVPSVAVAAICVAAQQRFLKEAYGAACGVACVDCSRDMAIDACAYSL